MSEIGRRVASLRRRLGQDEGLERIEQMLEISAGTRAPEPAPLQWGTGLFVPGLEAKPWYERTSFDWVPAVESRYARIREELRDLAATGVRRPYLVSPNDAAQTPADETHWTAVFLYRNGLWISDSVAHCRETQAAISATPQGVGEALLSLLAPRGTIDLHSGGSNVFLTCHLPIDVPPGCAIVVAGEERRWTEGEVLIFDDSFAHCAWNESDRVRTCLIWDIWHPGLTPIEIAALTLI